MIKPSKSLYVQAGLQPEKNHHELMKHMSKDDPRARRKDAVGIAGSYVWQCGTNAHSSREKPTRALIASKSTSQPRIRRWPWPRTVSKVALARGLCSNG